mmetsp:Transcript_118717/g.378572  ORF Transcript_118717/g.378572 Transcript_118717/m.378572 type:complete len:85 (+) Transcript_118717:890-1144(+)
MSSDIRSVSEEPKIVLNLAGLLAAEEHQVGVAVVLVQACLPARLRSPKASRPVMTRMLLEAWPRGPVPEMGGGLSISFPAQSIC